MRHLPHNIEVGDRVELQLALSARIITTEPNEDGYLLTVRVESTENRSNGRPVRWIQGDEGVLDMAVEVGAKQRLLLTGMSARQREELKERFAGLPSSEAAQLLNELVANERDGKGAAE